MGGLILGYEVRQWWRDSSSLPSRAAGTVLLDTETSLMAVGEISPSETYCLFRAHLSQGKGRQAETLKEVYSYVICVCILLVCCGRGMKVAFGTTKAPKCKTEGNSPHRLAPPLLTSM